MHLLLAAGSKNVFFVSWIPITCGRIQADAPSGRTNRSRNERAKIQMSNALTHFYRGRSMKFDSTIIPRAIDDVLDTDAE